MRVPYGEDLANHTAPESCGAYREVRREALTGVSIGQPLSTENAHLDADCFNTQEGNTAEAIQRASRQSGGVRDPGMWIRSLYGNREISRSARQELSSPHREGEEP